ncbi:uncharacterized protein LOC134737650 [Pongo pygmaeus]|uniref:uncharacterized protein LOC134737650 n=1 Tax=Pongo pygmaeus TaxID=9600 RepID=UPI00300DA267
MEQHSPVRNSQGGRTQGAGSSEVAAAPGSGAPYASGQTPTSLGRCRRRQLGRESGRRTLPSCRGGTAGSAPERGGNFRPRGPPARADPHLPLVGLLPAAATAASKTNTTAASRRLARSASRPNVVIRRVAAFLGTQNRQDPSHSSALPLPRPSTPRITGFGHALFPSRDGARRQRWSYFPCQAGSNRAGATVRLASPRCYRQPVPFRMPKRSLRKRAHHLPVDRPGLLGGSYQALSNLRRLHSRGPWSGQGSVRTPLQP